MALVPKFDKKNGVWPGPSELNFIESDLDLG